MMTRRDIRTVSDSGEVLYPQKCRKCNGVKGDEDKIANGKERAGTRTQQALSANKRKEEVGGGRGHADLRWRCAWVGMWMRGTRNEAAHRPLSGGGGRFSRGQKQQGQTPSSSPTDSQNSRKRNPKAISASFNFSLKVPAAYSSSHLLDGKRSPLAKGRKRERKPLNSATKSTASILQNDENYTKTTAII